MRSGFDRSAERTERCSRAGVQRPALLGGYDFAECRKRPTITNSTTRFGHGVRLIDRMHDRRDGRSLHQDVVADQIASRRAAIRRARPCRLGDEGGSFPDSRLLTAHPRV
jgi:hypothetical protein